MFNLNLFVIANKGETMDNELVEKQNRALNVLVEAARLAQARGAFTLEQAALVAEAISVFKRDEPQSGSQVTDAVTAPSVETPVF